MNAIGLLLLAILLLAVSAAAQSSGDKNFKNVCSTCHGKDGSGKTVYGVKNNLPDLRSSQVQTMTDKQLADSIARGESHKTYPHSFVPRHVLTEEQVQRIVQELRTLAK
jgi:mono/diheme cytochrome c family protein